MATSFQAHVPHSFESPADSLANATMVPGISHDWGRTSNQSTASYLGLRKTSGVTSTTLADLVRSLDHRNTTGPSKLIGADHETLLEWIRSERMRKLPPEGSSYDKVLVWARLFVERVHSFEGAIQHFAGDSQMATQLAYIHCASLLGLGERNSDALLDLFSFFYRCSIALHTLVGRAELFAVSRSIKDQLILALADLVTLVVGVATRFHSFLGHMASRTVAIDIHSTFAGPIESFWSRCELVSELMWKHQLSQEGLVEGKVTEIKTIREWLEPEDPVLTHVSKSTTQFAHEREESTCLWMSPYLTRFLKSDQKRLAIIGKPGSGKSILATVINDKLQNPIGGVGYLPIFVPISSRNPALATPLAVVKCILSQLFASRIGNVSLYRTLSSTYERCRKTLDEEQHLDLLWDALQSALSSSLKGASETVLVVDGVDEATCGQTALLQRLKTATDNAGNLKLIVLGSEKQEELPRQSTVQITPELIFDDVAAVVRRVLSHCSAFKELGAEEREICVNRIVDAADGSFLWAKLASKRIRDESPSGAQALIKAVNDLVKANYAINDFVTHRLRSNVHEDAVKMITWLATAVRPLTVRELSALLSVQPEKGTIAEQKTDPLSLLKSLASLVFYQNNMVYLRHGQIRTAIVEALTRGKFIPGVKDAHLDLIQRCALYVKLSVTGRDEPSLDLLDTQLTSSLFQEHALLDFALRYWLGHTKTVFGCNTDQEIATAGKELSKVFPTCPLVPLLEMTVWKNKSTPVLSLWHDCQTRLYRQVLTARHPATLQAILCQALFYHTIQDIEPSQASQIFYNAAHTCKQVLSVQHVITMRMTKAFLEVTAHQSVSKPEITRKRIEMLQVLVECYKIHYGNTSNMVVSALSQLAQQYQLINEEHKAEEITASLQGNTTESTSDLGGSRRPSDESLLVQLHGREDTIEHGTVLTMDEVEDDETISSSFNFDSLLSKAERHAREGNLTAAERIYVEIWQRASKEYRLHRSMEWELHHIKAVMAYSEFLKSQKRETEVASILTSFWAEHENSMTSSEEVVAQFVAIGKLMKSVGLSWVALDVFKQCSTHVRHQSSLYKEIQDYTKSTSEEVMQSAGSFTSMSTTTESTLHEVLSSISTDSQFTATATSSLAQMYFSQHRWKDATKTLKMVLQRIWPSLFAPSVTDVALPSGNVQHCIELAQRLRDCYRYRRRSMQVEDICVRLYHAVRRDRPVGDKMRECITRDLVQLYERTAQTDKLISVHIDILNDYTKRFGDDHPTVLKELWTLVELTRPRGTPVIYYQRIVELLNKNSDTCHPDAFDPLLAVVTELFNQERYQEAIRPCEVLFNSLQRPNINPKLRDQAFVRAVYERYVHCLQSTHKEFQVIHDVTAQYRKVCLSVFGAKAAITIQATRILATLAQTSKAYETEAIQLYEELLHTQSDEVDIDYDDIQAILETIYEQQSTSLSHTEATSQDVQRAISVRSQRLSSTRSTYGWAHESSLSQMEELVSLYAQRDETQAASSMLQEATLKIISSEKSASRLTEAAKSIASCYKATGQVQRAKKLSQEIYLQIVAKDTTSKSSVKFDLTSVQRQSLLFLAQLEYSLREKQSSLTVAEIHSSLMAEYLYFEQFRSEIRSKSSSLQSVLAVASRLHGLLCSRDHSLADSRLLEQFTDYFMSTEGQSLQLQRSQATVFLSTLLEHFRTHSSQNFLRSVALACHNRVVQDLSVAKDPHSASDLALAAFRYIQAHDGFSSFATAKLMFKTGLALANWAAKTSPESHVKQETRQTSATIVQEMVRNFKTRNIDLTQLDAVHLNTLIGLLDKQKDYTNLVWVLTSLWSKRESHLPSQTDPAYTLALGRMLIITRYLVGDYTAAIRLAEDIVYNCARVHGPRHPATVEMTVLLSQMYTSVAQGYQTERDQRELAYRYYKKAAALHETALRVFIDPTSTSASTDMDGDNGNRTSPTSSPSSSPGADGKYVRLHLHLLKLAVERLGNWPKEYREYERLNSDLFKVFGEELKGMEGVEKWDLKNFGAGRAEANDDLISSQANLRLDLNPLPIVV